MNDNEIGKLIKNILVITNYYRQWKTKVFIISAKLYKSFDYNIKYTLSTYIFVLTKIKIKMFLLSRSHLLFDYILIKKCTGIWTIIRSNKSIKQNMFMTYIV